jgi:hypothetical protein
MWSSEENDLTMTEALIRDAAWMPQPTSVFRTRVLSTASQQQRQSRRVERIQILTTLTLAASLLWCLPGWLPTESSLLPSSTDVASESGAPVVHARGWLLVDDYEWGLVQAALAKKSHSAVLIRGLL